MNTTRTDPEILAALGFAGRPDVFIDRMEVGGMPQASVMLQYPDGGAAYLGAVVFADGAPYLGCITCLQPVTEVDAAMCVPCREDAAFAEAQRS